MASIYDFKALNNKGVEVDFKDYEGKVLLIVNTASKCGFTPQYDGLEALYQQYKDKGLVVIGFPCDQFAHQEPGSNEEIAEFCRLNHGVTFPLMAKVDVNGSKAEPIFEFLKSQAPTEEYKGLKLPRRCSRESAGAWKKTVTSCGISRSSWYPATVPPLSVLLLSPSPKTSRRT